MFELNANDLALGEFPLPERAKVFFEPPHHYRSEFFAPIDGDASGEALRIENLKKRREAVRVPVVGRRAEEQAVFEAGRDVAHHAGEPRVGGVAADAAGRRRHGVRLVENQHALLRALADVLQKRLAIFGPAKQRVAHDEPVVGRPGVDAETALGLSTNEKVPAEHLEREPEPLLHLVAPLKRHRGGADDEREVDALSKQKLLQNEAGFDRLTKTDVVGDEEVGAWKRERLLERRELVR